MSEREVTRVAVLHSVPVDEMYGCECVFGLAGGAKYAWSVVVWACVADSFVLGVLCLRSCQNKYQLMTVHTHGDSIVLSHWQAKPPAP